MEWYAAFQRKTEMPLKQFKSTPPKSPFGPAWEVPFWMDTFDDPDEIDEMRLIVLDRERVRNGGEPDLPSMEPTDGSADDLHGTNIFSWREPVMLRFRDFVHQAYLDYLGSLDLQRRRCYIQGWANIFSDGEKLALHTHDQSPYAYLSGNFTVSCDSTRTIYYPPYLYQGAPNKRASIEIQNEAGLLTLFPSALHHETSVHHAETERISLAFDIFLQDLDLGGRIGGQGMHQLFDFSEEELA